MLSNLFRGQRRQGFSPWRPAKHLRRLALWRWMKNRLETLQTAPSQVNSFRLWRRLRTVPHAGLFLPGRDSLGEFLNRYTTGQWDMCYFLFLTKHIQGRDNWQQGLAATQNYPLLAGKLASASRIASHLSGLISIFSRAQGCGDRSIVAKSHSNLAEPAKTAAKSAGVMIIRTYTRGQPSIWAPLRRFTVDDGELRQCVPICKLHKKWYTSRALQRQKIKQSECWPPKSVESYTLVPSPGKKAAEMTFCTAL